MSMVMPLSVRPGKRKGRLLIFRSGFTQKFKLNKRERRKGKWEMPGKVKTTDGT